MAQPSVFAVEGRFPQLFFAVAAVVPSVYVRVGGSGREEAKRQRLHEWFVAVVGALFSVCVFFFSERKRKKLP
jgi:C4-dicarboxylate transporter